MHGNALLIVLSSPNLVLSLITIVWYLVVDATSDSGKAWHITASNPAQANS